MAGDDPSALVPGSLGRASAPRRRGAKLAVLVIGALMLLAPVRVALADGDPASDVLLGTPVFYPYSPPVSASLQRTLNAETAAAAKAGLPLKVALIGSPVDLGVVPDLYGKPQRYAAFLDQEISYQHRQALLVVMRTGFGVQGLGAAATALGPQLPRPAGSSSDDLARAAIVAVARLARASGHPIRGVPGIPGADSAGGSPLLIVLVVVALLLAGALAAVTVQQRRLQRRAGPPAANPRRSTGR